MIITAEFNPQQLDDPNCWAVYSHTIPGQPRPAWIGLCPMGAVLIAPDARASIAWRQHLLPYSTLRLNIFCTPKRSLEAAREARRLIRDIRPPINALEPPADAIGARRVVCLDTNVIYESQTEACELLGISKSQMSSYLNRRSTGRIKGMRFAYV